MPDNRPIEDLNFGSAWKPSLGDIMAERPEPEGLDEIALKRWRELPDEASLQRWRSEHEKQLAVVRGILKVLGCTVADDIVNMGCTGLAARAPIDASLIITQLGFEPVYERALAERFPDRVSVGRFLRIGLGGSGIGLPCFVPPDRYCLIHEVTGGLQDGQKQHYADRVPLISRELTPKERAELHVVQAAQHIRGPERIGDALDTLTGRKEIDEPHSPVMAQQYERDYGAQPWRCSEHATTNWKCRYCVAQLIVAGELEPKYIAVTNGVTGDPGVHADSLASWLEHSDADEADVYVLMKTFKRRLA